MLIPILLLISLGVVIIYTSSPMLALQQLIFALIGAGLYLLIRSSDYRFSKGLSKAFYFFVFSLLVITFILGFETRGSIRWIPLGLFNLQPSELAKPALIIALASYWTGKTASWINILKSLGILLPLMFLVFKQPDLGTSLTLLFIWLIMLISSNISFFKVVLLGLLSLVIAPLSWFALHDYQKDRLVSFLSPTKDPQGIGFHVIQSMIAVGSGQLIGRGLGRGTQSRLQFLPEFRTDFIFAFIAEELGFLGSFIVLFLYLVIFFMAFRLLGNVSDKFGELIVIGVMGMMFFQIAVNIGMNIGLLPITGITLPLLSYGGSSLITTLISLGLLSSVAKFGQKKKEALFFGL